MRRILKALILAFIGKKIYDYAQTDDTAGEKPSTTAKSTRRKATSRSARAA